MKNMFKYAAAAVILSASLVSCELDNYDGPNAQIYGEVRDSKTGALIQQDINGTKIMYEELGFENPDRQQMIFKVSGEYRNNLMFAAKYDIYFEESNFVIPDRLEGYEIKRGENRLDFEVQSYIRISNASIRKEGSEIVATFTVTPTVDSNVRAVGLFGHIDYIVGDNYAHARATQNVNESFKDTGRVFTLRMDASPFKAGQAYYFRVGAVVDVANAKYNYAPSVRLTI